MYVYLFLKIYNKIVAADRTVCLWQNFKLGGTLKGHENGISDVNWSKDGNYLATASDDRTVKLWDADTKQVVSTLGGNGEDGHGSFVFSVDFNPQGSLLVSGSYDETLRIWDVRTGKCIKTIAAHSEPITSASFSHDGTMVLSSAYDGLAYVLYIGKV